jgi:hypothetical protein
VTFVLLGRGEPTESLRFTTTPDSPPSIFPLQDDASAGPFVRPKADKVVLEQLETPEHALARWRKTHPGARDPATPPTPQELEVGQVSVPDSNNVVVLVQFDGNTVRRLQAFDQSEKAVPAGKLRLTNLCSVPVAIQLGQSKTTIPAAGQESLALVTPNGRPASVRLGLAWQNTSGWELLSNTMTVVDPSARRLGFIQPAGQGAALLLLPPAAPDPSSALQLAVHPAPTSQTNTRAGL